MKTANMNKQKQVRFNGIRPGDMGAIAQNLGAFIERHQGLQPEQVTGQHILELAAITAPVKAAA